MATAQARPGRNVASALLRTCSAPDSRERGDLAMLRPDEWLDLVQRAIDLRILPLLARAISHSGTDHLVPAQASALMEKMSREYAFLVLRRSKSIARIHSLLRDAGLRPVFLKGAALAFDVYPASSLRPSRDADILLSPAEAAEAQKVLLGTGEFAEHPGVPHARTCRHHFFPLQHDETGIAVEVHHALTDLGGWHAEERLVAMLLEDTHSVSVLGEDVAVASPMANILHLAMHAGRASYLDNGPLTLADMHFLFEASAVDPVDALDRADEMQLGNSFAIVAALADRYGAAWVTDAVRQRCAVADAWLDAAEEAVLPTPRALDDNKLAKRVDARVREAGPAGPLGMALKPDPKAMALEIGVDQSSPVRWLGYPLWLTRRITRYIRLRQQRDLDRDRSFREWLKSG